MNSNTLESNWRISNRHMLEQLSLRITCTAQWPHDKDSNEPSFDINTALTNVSTSKFPPFIKVHISTICTHYLRQTLSNRHMLERLSNRKLVGRESIHFEVSNVNKVDICCGIVLIQLECCYFRCTLSLY